MHITSSIKATVQIIATALWRHGVEDVVVSPGSRCAPLTVALSRSGRYRLHAVVDERCAAFVGLGIALATDRPVALVCTSGSAPLNYGPALAEAYYRRVPLIAITADRPAWWVGQREGQTIRQAGCLQSVTRRWVDIPPDSGSAAQQRHAAMLVETALNAATGNIAGPVQINVQLDAPLTAGWCGECDVWSGISTRVPLPDRADLSALLGPLSSARTLVVAGGVRLDDDERSALAALAELPGVAVVAEAQTNIPGAIRPAAFDRCLCQGAPVPQLVAIVGGDMVSGRFKQWLRSIDGDTVFVSVTPEDEPVDTYGHFAANVPCSVGALAMYLRENGGTGSGISYADEWRAYLDHCATLFRPKAFFLDYLQQIIDRLAPADVHVSNGSAIRYVQHLDIPTGVRMECNRGVSGIDGCTSTAIGWAMASERQTLLISGDMSAAYDVGALALQDIPPTFKMVILDNRGGDIFRNIATTRNLSELEPFFAMQPKFPVEKLADAYGFAYFEASAHDANGIRPFCNHRGRAILRIIIDPKQSKDII